MGTKRAAQPRIRELRAELDGILRDAVALDADTAAVEVLTLPIPEHLIAAVERAKRKVAPGQDAFVLWGDVGRNGIRLYVVTEYEDPAGDATPAQKGTGPQ